MIRSTPSAPFAAFALFASFALGACRSADCPRDGHSAAPNASLPKPEPGTLVRLYLTSGTEQVIGTVASVDGEIVRIETIYEGHLVADWRRIAAWESGAAVELTAGLLPSLAEMHEYSRQTKEMIRDTMGRLTGDEAR